ncbi:MAG: DEAD/DEAH box helicase family protein [Candidatus Acidiferrales bacterium]
MLAKNSSEEQLKSARNETERLRAENAHLRAMLGIPDSAVERGSPPEVNAVETPNSRAIEALTPERKVALFRSLFRGREDVYAVRWEGKSGKSGYSPAGVMDWRAIHAARPEERKKVSRRTQTLQPLTDSAIRDHLTGKQTIGVYPLLPDETCWFLAVDFDKKSWMADAAAFASTCRRFQVPVSVERSRSGNGAHIWLFFNYPVLAANARQLGCALLTRTMESRHEIGLDSYDRLFPSQDTLPKGGFGNLIALPLQKPAREQGNSVFLDELFQPYVDQWKFLESVQKIPTDMLARMIQEIAPSGNTIGVHLSFPEEGRDEAPWLWSPSHKRKDGRIADLLPSTVRVVVGNVVYIEKKDLPSAMLDRLIRIAAFQNPEFYRAQAMRLSTYGKPRVISCSEDFPEHIGLPRGCIDEVLAVFRFQGVNVALQDERTLGREIEVSFNAELRPEQKEAINQVLHYDQGVLSAPTAFGKTVVSACLIARRGVNTLILVHRRQLMDQWRERLSAFLDMPIGSIGQIGGGKIQRTGVIDVAVIQSLQRKGDVEDFVADYGHVIADECHHLSAVTFERLLRQVKAKYILGLTATPIRRDGHHPIIYMQCGSIRFHLTSKKAAQTSLLEHRVIPRFTNFSWKQTENEITIQNLYAALVGDQHRNELIIRDLQSALSAGRSPLVLTSRTDHLDYLAGQLQGVCSHVFILTGGMGEKQRTKLTESLAVVPSDEPRVILATGSYLGEGFDDARLDTLLLAMPVSWRGTLQQYVGRLHRLHENKKEVQVYDYADVQVPMLARMYKKRLAGYAALGYTLTDALHV